LIELSVTTVLVSDQRFSSSGMRRFFEDAGFEIVSERVCNGNRDLFFVVRKNVALKPKENLERFYVKFRRGVSSGSNGGLFQSFARQFPDFYAEHSDLGNVGESINVEVLQSAIDMDADKLFFCYGDGKVFWCYPLLFLKFSQSYGLVRSQYFGERKRLEITASIPFKLLNEFNMPGVVGNEH
jgi:hypothetical protein